MQLTNGELPFFVMKKYIVTLLLVINYTSFGYGQLFKSPVAKLAVSHLNKVNLPTSISYNGNLVKAVKWKDKTGDNIVLLTVTNKTETPNAYDKDTKDAALYAYHFIIKKDSIIKSWRVYDFVKSCFADIFLNFVENSFAITDLNKDGYAEVWMMYQNSCRSDVSPISMKIIMYENNKKFALRGETKVKTNKTDYIGGTFTLNQAFKQAPVSFRRYALQLWNKHKAETCRS
jgi:hypothetical protein